MGVDTINAVLTKQADTGIAADYVAINCVAKGRFSHHSKDLQEQMRKSSKEQQLLVKGNIKTPSDLKGKKIGVNKGTVNEYVWSQYLKKNQIKETDIEFVPFSTPDQADCISVKRRHRTCWADGWLKEM